MLHRVNHICLVIFIFGFAQSCLIEKEEVYFESVKHIFELECSNCHFDDGPAPFALNDLPSIKRKLKTIEDVVSNDVMPPWPADPNYREFIGQKSLSIQDKKRLISWIDQGARSVEADNNWVARTPEAQSTDGDRYCMQEAIELKGDNQDKFRLARIPIELEKDTFIRAIRFLPGNNKLVHHMNGHWLNYEEDKKKDLFEGKTYVDSEKDTDLRLFLELGIPHDDGSFPTLTPSVVNYLPGMEALKYPKGIGGFKAYKKSSLLMQSIHYGPTAIDDQDLSCLEIEYADGPPERPIKELQMGTLGISPIEPEFILEPESKQRFTSKWKTDRDLSLLSIIPHMHLLGTTYKAYALSPEGKEIPLIKIDQWDFRWQYVYTFPKILKIPKGYTIIAEGEFDNTSSNPNQAFDPPRRIVEPNSLNMKTTDEMFQFIIMYIDHKPGDETISLVP